MAAIFKMTFWYAFSWMEILIRICLTLVHTGPINGSSISSDIGLAPARRQTFNWTDDGYIIDAYMRHSASMR